MPKTRRSAPSANQWDLVPNAPRTERFLRINAPGWIDYPMASEGLEHLSRLYHMPPGVRPYCCVIVGPTNNGKTSLAEKFLREMTQPPTVTDEITKMPVAIAQTPPIADVGSLYSSILRAVGAPPLPTAKPARKQEQILALLPQLGTKMLIVDELHNILDTPPNAQKIFLNALKFLSNELRIPLVGIGTDKILRVVQTDPQLGNRFEPFFMPPWKPDGSYARFLVNICANLGLPQPKSAAEKHFLARVHALSEGLTGETLKLMRRLLEHAEATGAQEVTMDMLKEIKWTRPGERRGDGNLA